MYFCLLSFFFLFVLTLLKKCQYDMFKVLGKVCSACNAPALNIIRLNIKITIYKTHIITLNIYQRPELCVTRTTITILDAVLPKASEIITVLLTIISDWRGSIWCCLHSEGWGTIIVFVLVRTVVVWERLSERDQRRRVNAQVHLRAPQIPGITDCLN